MTAPERPLPWGGDVRREFIDGVGFLMLHPRPKQVAALLDECSRWPDRVHLVQGDDRLTFAEVQQRAVDVAGQLRSRGVGDGDTVMLAAANSTAWVLAFWGVLRSGATVALANAWWNTGQFEHACDLAKPTLVLCDRRRLPVLEPIAEAIDIERLVDEEPSGASLPDIAPLAAEGRPAVILFTSGSSGPPKGAVLAHRSLVSLVHGVLHRAARLPHQVEHLPASSLLQSTPLFHVGGLQSLLVTMATGAKLVMLDGKFDAEEALRLIDTEQIAVVASVPTTLLRLANSEALGNYDLSSVRSIGLGGAPVRPELLERLAERMPRLRSRVGITYGLSEAGGPVTIASAKDAIDHPGSSGTALPTAEIVIDAEQPDDDGEILVRIPSQMLGYLGEPTSPIDDNGWLHTGDVGRLRDGHLYVTSRIKEVIIRGGENIAAPHVEAALLRHPAVLEAAVVGVPDHEFGEAVGAAVVVRNSDVSPLDLAEFIAEHLAYFEIPSIWHVGTRPLPTLDVGKVDKQKVLADLRELG